MTNHPKFPARYSHRSQSFLSGDAQDACYRLGEALRLGTATDGLVAEFRAAYRNVAAGTVPQTSKEIRDIARIYQVYELYTRNKQSWFPWSFFRKSPEISTRFHNSASGYHAQLSESPTLAWLLIHSGNGYVRQAAIEALNDPPQCPFEFCAIAYLLNDWVGNVREAANAYCAKHLEKTPTEVVAESSSFLLAQMRNLKRWDQEGRDLVAGVIYRPAVVQCLKEKFLVLQGGSAGATFQQLLQRPEFDQHMIELSENAALPAIRAKASEVLLNRRARWFTGYKREWVDKSLGVSRRMAVFEDRPIEIDVQFDEVLQNAAADKSAHVRKVAADALIANRSVAGELMDQIADTLLQDQNSSVRSRAEFYARKRSQM